MKKIKKVLSLALSLSMIAAVSPMQKMAMAAETESLVYNENFNGYETVSDLGSNWKTPNLTTIGDGKDGGKALYVGLDAATDNYMATYTLDEAITSGKVIVSYSIKPGENISTNIQMANSSQYYMLNFIKPSGEILEGTSSDPAACYKMGTHDIGKWYDFVTTIDLEAQTVTSTMTDENGESVTTPANAISWGTGGSAMHEITKFNFQVWSKKDSGSYFDNFKVIHITKDAFPIENITKGTASIAGNGKTYSLGTSIISGEYVLTYDFYPTTQGFVGMQYDGVEGNPTFYFMTFFYNGILKYGSASDPTANMNAPTQLNAEAETPINVDNLHKAQIKFNLEDGSSTCVVTDTVTGQTFTKSRNLMWCSSDNSHNGSWTARDIESIHVRSWSAEATNVSNVCLARYVEAATVTKDSITISDASGSVQEWDNVSVASNTVTINFGKEMNADTLNAQNVYIENTTDSKKVNHTAEYADGVYTMNLGEMLQAGAEYKIVISKDVETSEGGKNAADTTFTFTTNAPVIESDKALNVELDFDDLTAFDGNFMTNAESALVPDEDGGMMLEQGLTTGDDNLVTWYKLPQSISTGKYELSYSFKPGKGIQTNVMAATASGNMNHFFATMSGSGSLYYGSHSDPSALLAEGLELDTWYDVKVEFDLDAGTSSAVITDKKGNEWTKSRELRWCTTASGTKIPEMSRIGIQVWSKTESASYIDNIVFKQVVADPTVTAKSIVLSTVDGEVAENFTSVSPLTNKVSIDFGTMMDVETLTSESVKLTNKATGEVQEYTPTYADGVYTLNLPGILEANTTYTLTVSKDVANAVSVALGDDVVIDFTTTDGVTKATLKTVTVGNTEITALNQIQSGDNMAINFDYANSTNEDKTLYVIVAYYYDGELVDVDYITEAVSKDITCGTYKVNHTVGETELIDSIKIMSWDGFDTMKPLSKSLVIK